VSRSFKRIALWILISLILFPLLLAALQFFATRIINQDAIKNHIETTVSQKLGGELHYKDVRLSIFPRPRVVIRAPSISIPGSFSATLRSIDINFELWPLLRGQPRVENVRLDRPEITLALKPPRPSPNGTETPAGAPEEQSIATLLGVVASEIPSLEIQIQHGRFTINQNRQILLTLRDVDGRIVFLPIETPAGGSDAFETARAFRITGSVEAVLTDDATGPGPVRIRIGSFDARPRMISFSDSQVRMLDAAVNVSGRIQDGLSAEPAAEVIMAGTVGYDTVQWIRTAAALPAEWVIHAPVFLSQVRLLWQYGGSTRIKGSASLQHDVSLSFNLERGPDYFTVHGLRVRDNDSQALLALSFRHKVLDLSFTGNLAQATLGRLFERRGVEFGWLKGDFRTRVVLDHPRDSTAQGRLEGERLVFPFQTRVPVLIDHVILRAEDKTLTLDPVVVRLSATPHTVRGQITAAPDQWLLNLTSDGLDWEPLARLFASDANRNGSPPSVREPILPRATVLLAASSFTIGHWTAAPVRLEISVGSTPLRIALHEAVVCGVNLPGLITIAATETRIAIKPSADGQNLESTLACFGIVQHRIAGTFNLSGALSASGFGQTLLDTLDGIVAIKAKDGRVFQDSVVVRILTYLNVTDLLRGKFPGPERDGIPYKSLAIRGTLKKGTLSFDEAVFVSPVVNLAARGSVRLSDRTLDLTVLAAPFTTADVVIKRIPLLKDILAGSLISIPIRITGSIDQPEVTAVSPDAVAKELTGLMKRTLGAPFKILEPVLPGRKNDDRTGGRHSTDTGSAPAH